MRRRRRRVLAIAFALAVTAAVASVASAGPSAVRVTLTLAGSKSKKAGQFVSLTAKASIPRGDELAIIVKRESEKKLRVAAECGRSPCTGRWREKKAQRVAFEAIVTDGTDIHGKSRVIVVSWRAAPPPPPPPPPPPAPAQVGHYDGTDSQNEKFGFDVPDGKTITNLITGQINTSCTPDIGRGFGGNLSLPGPFPINADGSFSISISDIFTITDIGPAQRSISITGRFSGGLASGTLLVTYNVLGAVCTTNNQTWNVTKTG